MVAFADSRRPPRRAPAPPCVGSSSCATRLDQPLPRNDRNQQYSVIALTNGSAAIQERYAYTAYGAPTITDPSGTTRTATAEGNRYTYTGREWDEELNLYHYRARMYDPMAGRFLGRDPIGYTGSRFGLYAFLRSGPMTTLDPTGLKQISIFAVQYEDDDLHPFFERNADQTGMIPIYFSNSEDLADTANSHLEQECDCVSSLETYGHSGPRVQGGGTIDGPRHGIWPPLDLDKPAPPTDVRWLGNIRFCDDCTVYMNGCNTGMCPDNGKPRLAEEIAITTGCKVFGSKGFLYGTHATGGERCEPTLLDSEGNPYHSYSGAVSATGDDCWEEILINR